jgi:hypothetical protein
MIWLWWILGIFVLVLWIFTIVNIIQRRHERSGGKTAAWIILVLVFPVLGTIVYFLVNGASGPVAPRDAEMTRTPQRY